MKPTELPPQDMDYMHEYRRDISRQARWIEILANIKKIPLDSVIRAAGLSRCDYRKFRSGRWSLTREEYTAVHWALKVPYGVLFELAVDLDKEPEAFESGM